jgi:hypothetical protein
MQLLAHHPVENSLGVRVTTKTAGAGYDPDSPLPGDDGWDISPALERSLVAYVPGR